MREIPGNTPYERTDFSAKDREERLASLPERKKVTSLLKGAEGKSVELTVAIDKKDGALRRVNFWDLDKTLLWAHDVHFEAITKLYPEAAEKDVRDLQETFEAGWRLGTSFREHDRMYRIFAEGKNEYRNVGIYHEQFLKDDENRKKIDEEGHPEGWHERAAKILERYDAAACAALKQMRESGKINDAFLIPAMVHLLQAKARLGEMNVFMTANPRNLANALVAYSGLNQYGFAVASDEDMVGGGKDIAILNLIQQIERAGFSVPKNRLVALGDSERGDVGSGYKLMRERGYTFQGVLVRRDMNDMEVFKKAAESDSELADMLQNMDVTLAASEKVRKVGKHYKFGRLGSAASQKPER